MKKILFLALLIAISALLLTEESSVDSEMPVKPLITMIELGSTTCVPCQMMEPVMESLRENYGDQIEVIFYDVKEDKEKAAEWKIRMIPTQVFLNVEGKEIHRHVGFYSEELIDIFLKEQGLIKMTGEGRAE